MSDSSSSAPAAAAAAAAAEAATADAAAPISLPFLYRHALESIFAFCNLRDLATVVRVSGDWSSAVSSMPSRRWTVAVTDATLPLCARSALSRHVVILAPPKRSRLGNVLPLSDSTLQLVAQRMTQLEELHCSVGSVPKAGSLLRLSHLRALTLHIGSAATSSKPTAAATAAAAALLVDIGRMASLEELNLHLPGPNREVRFSALASLRHLRCFTFVWLIPSVANNCNYFSDDQLRDLVALYWLDMMCMHAPDQCSGGRGVSALCSLLLDTPRGAHPLQWKSLAPADSRPLELTPEAAAALATLPSLTSLRAHIRQLPEQGLMRSLPNLRSLWVGRPICTAGPGLAAELQHCAGLTELEIEGATMSAQELGDTLAAMPHLAKLSLSQLWGLYSLRCFNTPALAASLTNLKLCVLHSCAPSEFVHLNCLRSLERLHIVARAEPYPVAPFSCDPMLFPNMKKFIYC